MLFGTVWAEGVVKIKETPVTDYELIQRAHPQDIYNCISSCILLNRLVERAAMASFYELSHQGTLQLTQHPSSHFWEQVSGLCSATVGRSYPSSFFPLDF